MILLAILAGLYAIGGVGYYKISHSMMMEAAPEIVKAMPRTYRLLMLLMALFWPVLTYWSLVKEAAK